MTYKTIDISEEVYNRLNEKKKKNESISDVIERMLGITKESKGISEFFGIWKDLPKEYFEIMEEAHKEMRREINKRFS
ncbi:MAG: hypothetical protein EU529_07395 [Promethearchaeota archaeon]|nr:MAG: hypothetical protein EU529_07395 [Candidatus Lokiarchaeota archaeon]